MEAENLYFHDRVREGFLTMARRCPERIIVLDAALSESALAAAACQILEQRFFLDRMIVD